jgi:2-methylcitrate dehydratase
VCAYVEAKRLRARYRVAGKERIVNLRKSAVWFTCSTLLICIFEDAVFGTQMGGTGSRPPTDTAAWALANYAVALKYEDLPPEVIAIAKRRILDTVGCALGAYASEPATILREVIAAQKGTPESTIIGSGRKTTAANATLVNGAMIRYLDFNDTYWSPIVRYVHPSNCIADALAVTERQHASGKDLILATVLGYEVLARLIDLWSLGNFQEHSLAGFEAPVVAGKLLKLNAEQIANAIGIGASHNFVLNGIYGEGYTSMMKCLGYSSGASSGVTAALLAQRGFTGPVTILETYNRNFEKNRPLASLGARERNDWAILKTWFKPYIAYHLSHSAITGVINLVTRNNLKPEQVRTVYVRGLPNRQDSGRQRSPVALNKEEADHNLGFLLAMAIRDREIGLDQYAKQQWRDPNVQELMNKIEFQGDAEMTRSFPELWTCTVEITTGDGKSYQERVDLPKGGPKNPLTDRDIEAKFKKMALKLMPQGQVDRIIKAAYALDSIADISGFTRLLAAPGSAGAK